jgi:hypothetical protein
MRMQGLLPDVTDGATPVLGVLPGFQGQAIVQCQRFFPPQHGDGVPPCGPNAPGIEIGEEDRLHGLIDLVMGFAERSEVLSEVLSHRFGPHIEIERPSKMLQPRSSARSQQIVHGAGQMSTRMRRCFRNQSVPDEPASTRPCWVRRAAANRSWPWRFLACSRRTPEQTVRSGASDIRTCWHCRTGPSTGSGDGTWF